MSAIELTTLTREQEACLGPYRDHWVGIRTYASTVDHKAAEAGIDLAYRGAGLPPPDEIVWCQSPEAMERARQAAWYTSECGQCVKPLIVDNITHRVQSAVAEAVSPRVKSSVALGLAFELQYANSASGLSTALSLASGRGRWSAATRRKALAAWFGGRRRQGYPSFDQARWLPHEFMGVLANCAYFHNICGLTAETAPMAGIWQIAANSGGIIPHERVCWVSSTPDIYKLDPSRRFHSPKGPAVRYPDGWSLYSWKGIAVPDWVIEHPERIERYHVDRERNPIIRRTMIDIMTAERYVASGAPTRFAKDDVGTLWRRQWLDWDVWAAVEVVNGTPEPDGSFKHYFLQVPPEMRSPTEAVAWTYGLSAQRYSTLRHRT